MVQLHLVGIFNQTFSGHCCNSYPSVMPQHPRGGETSPQQRLRAGDKHSPRTCKVSGCTQILFFGCPLTAWSDSSLGSFFFFVLKCISENRCISIVVKNLQLLYLGNRSLFKEFLCSRGEHKKLLSISDYSKIGHHQQFCRYDMFQLATKVPVGESGLTSDIGIHIDKLVGWNHFAL